MKKSKKSNWIVNIEHMLLVCVAKLQVSKIKYDKENGCVLHHWRSGKFEGWEKSVPEITEEYKNALAVHEYLEAVKLKG